MADAVVGASACTLLAGQASLKLHHCRQLLSQEQGLALMHQLPPAQRFAQALRWDRIELSVQDVQSQDRILTLGVPSTLELLVLHTQGSSTQVLTRLAPQALFEDRPLPTPLLQVPLSLKPGPHVLHLGYRIYAGGSLEPELKSLREINVQTTLGNVGNGMMVGIMLTIILGISVYSMVGAPVAYWAYVGLVLSEACMLMQIEGYGFAYLWPHAPQWNQAITLVFACGVLVGHALFAISFLGLRERFPRLWLMHLACLVVCAVHLVWVLLTTGYREVSLSVVLPTALYALLAVITAVNALRHRLTGAPLYVLGAGCLVVFGFILFPLGVAGYNPFADISFFVYPKIGILLETGFFSAALVNRVIQFREQQAQQRMRRLAEAEELLHAEATKRQALALAQRQSLQLASASHDIAQPLASLRFAVTALKQTSNNDAIAKHLDQALDYTATLLNDIIVRSRDELQHELSQSSSVPLGELIAKVVQSHAPTAQAKGLGLKAVPCEVQAPGAALILNRILHNLLGNAIRYTERGRVVVGVRRRAHGWELQVHDSGPGMLPGQIHELMRPFQQGQQASQKGYGLGLFIVKSLCEQCGYRFHVHSKIGRGSCFGVLIPFESASNTVLTVSHQ